MTLDLRTAEVAGHKHYLHRGQIVASSCTVVGDSAPDHVEGLFWKLTAKHAGIANPVTYWRSPYALATAAEAIARELEYLGHFDQETQKGVRIVPGVEVSTDRRNRLTFTVWDDGEIAAMFYDHEARANFLAQSLLDAYRKERKS